MHFQVSCCKFPLYFVVSFTVLSLFFTPFYLGLVKTLALFCKLCIAASFAVAYIHSSEIFPTSIR